jgi:hypothetical protein
MTPKEYEDGRAAHADDKPLSACPYGYAVCDGYGMSEAHKRGWWTAGWIDSDMEASRENRR